jgi:hypothetical protein
MSAPQFESRDAMAAYAWNSVTRRARLKKHARLRKLRGIEAKPAVINGAALRLLEPRVDPVELLSKPLQKKMRRQLPAPIVNLQLHRSPLDAPIWRAFVKIYAQLFELSSFWSVSGEERDALIDRALDAERKAVIKATSVSAGSGSLDPATSEDFARYTEAGNALAAEPSRLLEQQTQLDAEAAALEYRAQIEAEENAKLQQAVETYARTLNRKHRHAVRLAITEPKLRNCTIAARTGAGAAKVAQIRANIEEMADRILTIPPEESSSAVEAMPVGVHDELLTQIAEAGEVDATAALDLAATFQAPDIDTDVSESVLHNYAKHKSTSTFMRDNWSGGQRMYSDRALITGDEKYGGRYADPAKIAERDQYADRIPAADMRTLEIDSVTAGVDLNGELRALNAYVERQEQEAKDAAKELAALQRRLRKAAAVKQKTAAQLADMAAMRPWVEMFCRGLKRNIDIDTLISDTLVLSPKSGAVR